MDKPSGMTSHDVVAKIRRHTGIKKVGHAGTLDPLATGVLIVCIGFATRLSEYAMHQTKRYIAQVRLGITTTTYDAEGEIAAQNDITHITRADVENALSRFTGTIEQLPPIYSAIKQGGRKLYEIARAGDEIELQPRQVQIDNIDILKWEPPFVALDITCASGTYIRSLAHDLGQVLGVGAHLSDLRRVASGDFSIKQAVPLNQLLNEDWQQFLLPPDTPLQSWPAITLSPVTENDIRHGRPIKNEQSLPTDTLIRAYAADGRFMALLRVAGTYLKPHKVFLT